MALFELLPAFAPVTQEIEMSHQKFASRIDACFDCAQACRHCAASCLLDGAKQSK